ncbi:N-acetylmuramoyl-L-alanine amidase [Luteolibacter sp. AS25]|uniref:N-acetylmuramoyl-L-alanine amidase n=1 Tax=Luteolibacter sp. AS25 TaxID=3135776 RepID=UPI00398AEBF7
MRFLPFLAILAILPACSPVSGPSPSGSSANLGADYWGDRPGPKGFSTVIIDAGHGGKDSGAVSRYSGQTEKAANLDLAKRLQSELSGTFRTVMMRSDDRFIDLDDRVVFANKYPDAILVSLHFNAGSTSRRGPETYWWRVDSHGLATRCQQAMKSVAPYSSNAGQVRRRLRLTRNPSIPCVLLEGGYMSNPAEAAQINSASHRAKLAKAIAGAIRAQAANGDAGTGPRPAFIKAPPSRPTDPAGS